MSVRSIALCLLLQSAFCWTAAHAADSRKPAIELSEAVNSPETGDPAATTKAKMAPAREDAVTREHSVQPTIDSAEASDAEAVADAAEATKVMKAAEAAEAAKAAEAAEATRAAKAVEAAEAAEAAEIAQAARAAKAAQSSRASQADKTVRKAEPASTGEIVAAAELPRAGESAKIAQRAEPGKAGVPAAAPAGAPADVPVPWWREAASYLGLAPDPHPGETAEPAPGRPEVAPDYIIGPGDLLGISVWRDESLTRAVVVLPDGKVAFPLVGDLVAGGKTVTQLKKELERKLARYITDAELTVEVKQSNSMIIYIIGRVNTPGRQMMVATTNVLQGLAMAGGLNPFARRSEVKVFRKQEGKTAVFSFNYDDVAEGRHLETNIDLLKGDVILVP